MSESSFCYPLRDQGFYTYNFHKWKNGKINYKSNPSSPNSVTRLIHRHDDGDMMMMATVKAMIKVVRLHNIISGSMRIGFASVL
jgi:hypothetical protein